MFISNSQQNQLLYVLALALAVSSNKVTSYEIQVPSTQLSSTVTVLWGYIMNYHVTCTKLTAVDAHALQNF